MTTKKGPTEGGAGGKRGHSNMEHCEYTEEIKRSTKIRRRINGKNHIRNEINDLKESGGKNS